MSDVLSLGKQRAKELGLEPWATLDITNRRGYSADDIHKILGSGRVVRGAVEPVPEDVAWQYESQWDEYDDHQALLIGIKPIVQESEERKLLREWFNSHSYGGVKDQNLCDTIYNLHKRTRALLGEKP